MSRDCIQLVAPAKPEYILVTRLTTSAVANRLGFDVDTIEDIKIAVAEAAILIMNQEKSIKELILKFFLEDEELFIEIKGSEVTDHKDSYSKIDVDSGSDIEQKEMSMFILESMMDSVKLHKENGFLSKITMCKNCRSR